MADLGDFHKRIKRAVFLDPRWIHPIARPFCAKSDWVPPPQALPGEIFDFLLNFESDNEMAKRAQAPPPNLSAEEIKALDELTHRQDIVIKPVDKGSVVLIMDMPDYVQEDLRQLGDVNFYSKLQGLIFQDTIPEIQGIVLDLVQGGFICQQQARYLVGEPNPRPRRFYLLPKVHKPRDKQCWIAGAKVIGWQNLLIFI